MIKKGIAMKRIYEGKTKDVYKTEDGKIVLKFKDDLTGEDGVFDPGANTVGLTVEGAGEAALRMSTYFFKKFAEKGLPTHYINSNLKEHTMTVKNVQMFGDGLEVIVRYRAVGSFYNRYRAYCKEGQPLNGLIEMTIKDDEKGDPTITQEILEALNILSKETYEKIVQLAKESSQLIFDDLDEKGLELYDLKLEFGKDVETGEILIIDEISGGNMRVYKNGKQVPPLQLADYFIAE